MIRFPERMMQFFPEVNGGGRTLEQWPRVCAHSALHLEMRDGYMLDDPGYHAWQAGHRINPDEMLVR
ncbi:hypothetical protein AB0G15_06390 [Streptosporangium sp. NPDC023825]|uniref:hypothetical protein n=1 Tax=Streptosporangium sp. NPDC023825 TaxID=3154909 RepID=UPI003448556C